MRDDSREPNVKKPNVKKQSGRGFLSSRGMQSDQIMPEEKTILTKPQKPQPRNSLFSGETIDKSTSSQKVVLTKRDSTTTGVTLKPASPSPLKQGINMSMPDVVSSKKDADKRNESGKLIKPGPARTGLTKKKEVIEIADDPPVKKPEVVVIVDDSPAEKPKAEKPVSKSEERRRRFAGDGEKEQGETKKEEVPNVEASKESSDSVKDDKETQPSISTKKNTIITQPKKGPFDIQEKSARGGHSTINSTMAALLKPGPKAVSLTKKENDKEVGELAENVSSKCVLTKNQANKPEEKGPKDKKPTMHMFSESEFAGN